MKSCLWFVTTTVLVVIISFADFANCQSSDYTIQSVVASILDWGHEAQGYSPYRWQTTRDQLTDSIVGAHIRIDSLPVAASRIQVGRDGRAVWRTRVSLQNGSSPDGVVDIAIPEERCNHVVGTSEFTVGSVSTLDLSIRDTSDRLAMDIVGNEQINVIGQVQELTVDSGNGVVHLAVDISSWDKQGTRTEPAHISQMRNSVQSGLDRGNYQEADQQVQELLRLVPNDPEALQLRKSMTIIGSWGVEHDHGVDGFLGGLLGGKSSCTGTLIVRYGYIEFRSDEHPGNWSINSISSVGLNTPIKGFHIKVADKNWLFLTESGTTDSILEAIDKAQSSR